VQTERNLQRDERCEKQCNSSSRERLRALLDQHLTGAGLQLAALRLAQPQIKQAEKHYKITLARLDVTGG